MAATAGELVIKIAADYAELRSAMSDIGGKLDQFGAKADSVHGGMARGFAAIKTAVGAFAAALGASEILAYGKHIEETVGNMADLADNLKLTITEFQAFESAAFLAGQKTESVGTALGKFNVFMGKASEGSKEQVERLNELGVKILDINGKLRPQADLLQEVAIKIKGTADGAARAAQEVAFFGKSGQAVSAILDQWAKGTAQLNRELEAQGLVHLPSVVKQLDELDDRAAKAAKKVEVLFAPFYAAAKTAVIETAVKNFENLTNAINNLNAGKANALLELLIGLARLNYNIAALPFVAISKAVEQAGSVGAVENDIKGINAEIEKLQKNLADPGNSDMAIRIYNKQLDEATLKLARLTARQQILLGGGALESVVPPAPVLGGAKSPGVKGAGDSIADEIEKLKNAQLAADSAVQRFNSKRGEALEDVKRNVETQKAIDEKVGDLMIKAQRAGVAGSFDEKIKNQVRATIEAQNALKLYEADATAADAATRSLGSGAEEYAKTLRDLARQQNTGRLSTVAFERATYAATEKLKDQREEVARFRGGYEGFSAGIEKAARDYEKANDAYSMGGKVFTGVIDVMNQSLDVLQGTSSRTFQEIAVGFARMLAQMALQAALSPVFKYLAKALSGGGGSGIDAEISDWSTYGSGGGGGGGAGFFASLLGMFAGGKAIGGPVMPGMSYNVGEHGPERFTPAGAGTITPYSASANGAGVTVNLDMKKAEGARDPSAALEFGRKVKVAVVDIITNEKRPGGLLYGG